MRFFKHSESFNWKYILGEIVLIFIGITLAIGFDNWNSAQQSDHNKDIAIIQIKDEIQNNIQELLKARKANTSVMNAYNKYSQLYDGNSSSVLTDQLTFHSLQESYPDFFRVTDSVRVKANQYRYSGSTFINIELIELTDIAWETTRSIGIANTFDYSCLYELSSMYKLQARVQNELNKAADALQNREITRLFRILGFIDQLDKELESNYTKMLKQLDKCN
ncbi:MAG: hypothetical protein KDD94_04840 [Calditrichaeota bacterium]|nr:hypothetical protein [Calditrichota bacterium]